MKRLQSGLTKIDVIILVVIFSSGAAIILPMFKQATLTSGCRVGKFSMLVLVYGIDAYESDLNAFPPDHGDTNTKKNPTPTARAEKLGEFNEQVTEYFIGNLLRHLDGDVFNDGDTGENDLVSARPLDCYFKPDCNYFRIDDTDPEKPIIKNMFGTTIKYNELASERRSSSFQKNHSDPTQAFVFFDSFQIYTEDEDIEMKKPKSWITTFRE